MADLTPLADRLNDIEINANAPLTESLFRRFGSNINFLLDFLGISDGSSVPSGTLSDLANAITTIEGHTITLQATMPTGNGVNTVIGTYPSIKYVDRIFYVRATSSWGAAAGGFATWLTKNVDGNGKKAIIGNKIDPSPTGTIGTIGKPIIGTTGEFSASFDFLAGDYLPFQTGIGTFGYESVMRDTEWFKLCTLDWREGNSTVLEIYKQGGNAVNQGSIYMGYKLNLESLPLFS